MATRSVRVQVSECDACGRETDPTLDHYVIGMSDGALELDLCGLHAKGLRSLRDAHPSRFAAGRLGRPRLLKPRGIHPVHATELPPPPQASAG